MRLESSFSPHLTPNSSRACIFYSNNGKSTGRGFVELEKQGQALESLNLMQGTKIRGREIRLHLKDEEYFARRKEVQRLLFSYPPHLFSDRNKRL